MPNIYVIGLDAEATRAFSRHAADLFERELGTPREHLYVFRQEAAVYRDGVEATLPIVVRVSWIRRPPEQFLRAARGLTRIVREELGHANGSVQIELHEKWDDATVDGELCSAWAKRNR